MISLRRCIVHFASSKNMKNLLILLLVVFASISCQETPETKFKKDGVSFIVPKGWEITDEENFYDEGYYLAIEKDGLSSSGLITVTWVNGEFELNEWIEEHKVEIKNSNFGENSDVVFGDTYESKFNSFNALSMSYTFTSFGLKHDGIIHVFHEKEKTFSLLIQEATEDKSKNKGGFEFIEKSFRIK